MMHLSFLILIYVPCFLLLTYVDRFKIYRSTHSFDLQMIVLSLYVLVVLPFVLLTVLFQTRFNRWLQLKCPINETKKEHLTEGNHTEEERNPKIIHGKEMGVSNPYFPKGHPSAPPLRVDPFRTKDAFMVENKHSTNQLLKAMTNKRNLE